MKKNILFISYDGMTDPLGQSQVIPYLVGLTKFGYTFTILSCDKPGKYTLHKSDVINVLADYPIKWVSIPYHKSPPILSSWYDARMLRKTAVQLHKAEKFDLVHTRVGTPALVGHWLKKHLGIKFLYDIRGFWADERVDGGIWNIRNPVYRFIYNYFKKKEDEFLINSDYNVCLTYAGQKEIHSWKRIPNQPVPLQVIPCSVDMELFDPEKIVESDKEQLKNQFGIKEEDIIITYLGSIGGWYLTDEIMRFCKLFSDKIPEAKFLFIAPHMHEEIKTAAAKHGIPADNLIVTSGKRREVPMLLSLGQYSIFFIKPCYSKKASSPTKQGEIMAMGIPVIINSGVGDVKEIVEKYNAGYVIDEFTDNKFNAVIEKIANGNSFNKVAIRKGAEEFYSLSNAVQSYANVYRQIFQ
ncbi:MAG: glycosyltransferase [Ferruginibacter sp.]